MIYYDSIFFCIELILLNLINGMHPVKLWISAILGYCAVIAVLGFDFNVMTVITISSMTFLIAFNRKNNPKYIDDPVSYIIFDDINMTIGSTTLPISSIRQVALDTVKNEGYFSLPLNQSSPGTVPAFIFPAVRIDELSTHLKNHLPDSVLFIR